MNKGIVAALVALLVASALVAGCGGNDEDASGSEPTLTKAQFVKRANAICAGGSRATVAGYDKFYERHPIARGQELTKALEEELVETALLPNVKNQARELAALPVPEGDEDEIEDFLDALDQGIEEIEEEPLSFLASQTENPLLPAVNKAAAYGIAGCGGGGS